MRLQWLLDQLLLRLGAELTGLHFFDHALELDLHFVLLQVLLFEKLLKLVHLFLAREQDGRLSIVRALGPGIVGLIKLTSIV